MLVLSRKVGERIIINGNVVVEVLEIYRNEYGEPKKVRLGITAPREVPILREEQLDKPSPPRS